jgi:hypothetical protein
MDSRWRPESQGYHVPHPAAKSALDPPPREGIAQEFVTPGRHPATLDARAAGRNCRFDSGDGL